MRGPSNDGSGESVLDGQFAFVAGYTPALVTFEHGAKEYIDFVGDPHQLMAPSLGASQLYGHHASTT